MKHNNQLPNQHFKKEWQQRVRTWFDQPGRKLRRHNTRVAKAAKIAPRPIERLRPVVRCQTIKYNRKVRVGRAKISPKWAQTVGIAVDFRRKNRSEESLNSNVARLNEYRSRLVVLPRNSKNRTPEIVAAYKSAVQATGTIIPVTNNYVAEEPRKITQEEKDFKAFYALRQARANKRYRGVRDALAKARAEEEAQKGLSSTTSWNHKSAIKNNADNTRKALHSMCHYLSSRKVPLVLRAMLIRSVLLPMATYGGELFGMSIARSTKLQNIIGNACRAVMGCGSSTALSRLRDELKIATVNTKTAVARELVITAAGLRQIQSGTPVVSNVLPMIRYM
ncbi:hypothetical protein BB561_005565 [Smittium simulii]|uniref:60S ribosomal protein L13 n=1 Tax=Smittium simulii TaxID=133385 RepID=A0A2T9Y9T0_9FUNG|nr:hypothetical protein BB561_005565 [Smittium simulii]